MRFATLVTLVTLAIAPVSFVSDTAHAHTCPPGKSCFYVPAAMPSPTGFGNVGYDLVLASFQGAVTGTYQFGNTGAPIAFSVTASAPSIVNLTPSPPTTLGGLLSQYEIPEDRAIIIVADTPHLSVSHRLIVGVWQTSGFIKPAEVALGTRFRSAGFSLNFGGSDSGHDVLLIAAPTGANVTLTAPPGAPLPFWAGTAQATYTLAIPVGQSVAVRTVATGNVCNGDGSGALVTSDAPIAVSSGGRGWASNCNSVSGGCGDDGVDNVVPASQWGDTFVINDFQTGESPPGQYGERVVVVADTPNTWIKVNGVYMTTLNDGGVYWFAPAGVTLLETSKPVLVMQSTGLSQCELGQGLIPPASFLQTTGTVASAFNVSGRGQYAILIETTRKSTVSLDGNALSNPNTIAVPGRADLVVLTGTVQSGNHVVTATGDFQLGLVTAAVDGSTGLFAYYSRYRTPNCGDNKKADTEGCDDGNLVDGDGCSSSCRIELGRPGCTTDMGCTVGVLCDPANGTCTAPCNSGASCDDGNECTVDRCDAPTGRCQHDPAARGAVCATGICNGSPTQPMCQACVVAADCDDGNPCTYDTCPPRERRCIHYSEPKGTGCVGGGCTGLLDNPVCQACGADEDCDDANPCTGDTCDPQFGCEHTVADDGAPCAGAGFCQTKFGQPTCVGCIDDASCDDGNPCTTQTCNTVVNQCIYRPTAAGTACEDSLPGVCNGDPLAPRCTECAADATCDDQNPCTVDTCAADGHCVHTPEPQTVQCPLSPTTQGFCAAGTPNTPQCVQCTDDTHCPADHMCHIGGTCIPTAPPPPVRGCAADGARDGGSAVALVSALWILARRRGRDGRGDRSA